MSPKSEWQSSRKEITDVDKYAGEKGTFIRCWWEWK
jgi:hypothetical protein